MTSQEYNIKSVEKAMCIAYNAHNGQTDKQGIPYIFHCFAVANKFQTSNEQIVALLHDVIEDTEIEFYDIGWQFDTVICDALKAITKQPNEPYVAYIERVAQNPIALRVKIEDLKHNLSRIHQLTYEDQSRLRPKYMAALARLEKINHGSPN